MQANGGAAGPLSRRCGSLASTGEVAGATRLASHSEAIIVPIPHSPAVHDLSRRQFLVAVGGAAAGLAVPLRQLPPRTVGASTFTGAEPVRASHARARQLVGGARASWEAQYAQAAANDIDVLFMTDHDSRATAYNYLNSLAGAKWVRSSLGCPCPTGLDGRREASIRLLAESSSTTLPASVTLAVQPDPNAKNRLRTGISGQLAAAHGQSPAHSAVVPPTTWSSSCPSTLRGVGAQPATTSFATGSVRRPWGTPPRTTG